MCQARVGDSALPLCGRCYEQIPWIGSGQVECQVCGRYEACSDCGRRVETFFACNRSAVQYDDRMKGWLGRLKYRGDERLAELVARMMEGALVRLLAEFRVKRREIACITYVPLSRERYAERGFNQTELVARALGVRCGIPVMGLLRRARHTDKQSYKSRAERLRDMVGVFEFGAELGSTGAAGAVDRLAGRAVVLLDDVYTTGSTMNECAKAIRERVDCRVYGLTWAR